MNSSRQISHASTCIIAGILMLFCARPGRAQSDGLPGLSDQVEQAREQYESTLDQLVRARANAMQQARSSPEYLAAATAVTQSYQICTQDREQVIADLKANNPDYAKLVAQKQAVMSDLEAARQDTGTTVQRFNELYNRKSAVKKQMEAMQKTAMDKAGSGQHWQQWQTASRNLEALQARLAAQVDASSEVAKAQADADAAKSALAALDAQSATVVATNAPTASPPSDGETLITNNGWGDDYYGNGYGYGYGYGVGYGGSGRYAGGYAHGYRRGSTGTGPRVSPGSRGGRR